MLVPVRCTSCVGVVSRECLWLVRHQTLSLQLPRAKMLVIVYVSTQI